MYTRFSVHSGHILQVFIILVSINFADSI